MNAPSVDIKDILEAESSLGLTFATNLFVGYEPPTPDECVTIFDTPGFRVRSNSYTDGWDLIQDITTVLHGLSQETWNATLYSVIKCSSGPAMLDWDNNNRPRFIVNFDIQRR